ncbi:MAG: membrane protein insertion efficiency factor YidD, partial [Abditibacteriaceae bacterium]
SAAGDERVMEKGAGLSWPQRILLRLIRFYQRHISVLTPPSCRFTPTCSQYAIEAIERFGVIRGGLLAIWRLCRCQPFCKGGHDPLPDVNQGDSQNEE